MSASNQPQREG